MESLLSAAYTVAGVGEEDTTIINKHPRTIQPFLETLRTRLFIKHDTTTLKRPSERGYLSCAQPATKSISNVVVVSLPSPIPTGF